MLGIALSSRRVIGWIVLVSGVLNLGYCGYVFYILSQPTDDQYGLLVFVFGLFALGIVVNSILGIISGLLLARSSKNKILGWFVFIIAIISIPFAIAIAFPAGFVGLLELTYHLLLGASGVMLSHSPIEKASIESN